jgi:predicted dehydrogenase
MGARHLRVLMGLEQRFELAGVYDIRSDAPCPGGVVRLSSEAEALSRAEVVFVATPIAGHGSLVARALAAGRHVLVEKPLCATGAEARAAAAAARDGARLFVGHSERFNPVVRALARLLRGEELLSIDLRRVGPTRPSDHGVLVNLGVHDLDLGAYLGGGPIAVRGALGDDDRADVLFSTAGGGVGHLHVDRGKPERRRTIEVLTERWLYEGDLLAKHLTRRPRAGGPCTDVPLPLEDPLTAQAHALADALDGLAVREIASGADGARAVEAAEEAAAAFCRKVVVDAFGLVPGS